MILQRAKQVFARSSYAKASISELAHESEVTEPMLYKHFGSKKGLFLAVLEEGSTQVLATFRERMWSQAEKDTQDALAHIIDQDHAIITADPEIQCIHFRAIIQAGDPEIARCINKHIRALYELIRQLVELAKKPRFLGPVIPVDAATCGYMSMIIALQYNLMLHLSSELAPVLAEIHLAWLRGLHGNAMRR